MAWHDSQCLKLDLLWDDGRPGCAACQGWAPKISRVNQVSPPAPPPYPRRSELRCTWPPSIDCYRDQDVDDLEIIVRASIDSWSIGEMVPQQTSRPRPPDSSEETEDASADLWYSIYSNLNGDKTIRLLRLHGSDSFHDPIHCSLEAAGLDDPCMPIFEAVSYTWADMTGDSSLCEPVYLGLTYHVLPVTKSCLAVLRHFRTLTDRILWVDAICINQSDLAERSQQVSLMGDIYTLASRVLAHVGDSGSAVNKGLTLTRRPNESISSEGREELLRKPYFSRLWVVQEIKLAHKATITFGSMTIHWKALSSSTGTQKPATSVEKAWTRSSSTDLLALLQDTAECLCYDPRDRVFGLMGLVQQQERDALPIDYSFSVQSIYTGLAMYWMRQNRVDFIDLIMEPKRIPHLPSWVPDWTAQSLPKANRANLPTLCCRLAMVPDLEALSLRFLHNRFLAHAGIDSGAQNVFRGLGIRVKAIPLFTLTQDGICIGIISSKPLNVTSHVRLEGMELQTSDALHSAFYVPSLNRAFIVQEQAKNIYSLRMRCIVQRAEPDLGGSMFDSTRSLSGCESALGLFETNAIEAWAIEMMYLGIRTLPLPFLKTHEYSKPWLKLLDTIPQSVEACRSNLYSENSSDQVLEPDFEAMREIYVKIMNALFEINPSEIGDECGEIAHHKEEAGFFSGPAITEIDHGLAKFIREKRGEWELFSQTFTEQISWWESCFESAYSEWSRYGALSTSLLDVYGTDFQPDWVVYKGSVNPIKPPLVVSTMTSHVLIAPLLRVEDFVSNYTRFRMGFFIKKIYDFVSTLSLDPTMTWAWNRDRVNMCLVTFQLIIKLRKALLDRRVLMRMNEAATNPREIIIV